MVKIIFILIAYVVVSAAVYGLVRLTIFLINKLRKPKEDDLALNFTKLAKKTKRRRYTLIVWLSSAVVILLAALAMEINSQKMESLFWEKTNQAQNFFATQAPNVAGNNLVVDKLGIVSSNLHSDTYKNLDGVRVSWQSYDWHYGTIGGSAGYDYEYVSPVQDGKAYYTQGTNQKIAAFFSPEIDYQSPTLRTKENYFGVKPTHEAQTLPKLTNHVAEVAVSFDKPYSYEEIQKMIPSNLLINWYYIGLSDPKDVAAASTPVWFGVSGREQTPWELIGKEKSKTGEDYSFNFYDNFVKNIKAGQKYGGMKYNNFDPMKDALKQVEKMPTLDKAKFAGLIVTGRTEDLAKLDSEKWVFATNVGVTAEIPPYVTLTK